MGSGESTPAAEPAPGISFRLKRAHEGDAAALREALDELNERIKENGTDAGPQSPIRFSTIARVILYMALELGEDARKKTGTIQPQWKPILDRYGAFLAEVPAGVLPHIDDDDLRNFCLFSTRRNGNQTQRFYAALACFVIAEAEQGRLQTAFMKFALPDCEQSADDICRKEIVPICMRCSGEEIAPARAAPTPAHPEVSLQFAFAPANTARFENYRRLHALPEDQFAHFVIYRASRTEPARLMKSYLAISEPRLDGQIGHDDPSTFKFVHMYRPPGGPGSGVARVSLGRVFTFEHGVYLIGGQRDETTERKPFQSLKVMALPWLQLNREDKLLSALLMSSNYSGEQIVSRAAIRTTIIPRSDGIELGAVNVDELQSDLLQDAEAERAAAERSGTVAPATTNLFPLTCAPDQRQQTVNQLALNILRLTNNSPSWDLGHVYKRQGARREETLTRNKIEYELEKEFGSENEPKFRCAELDDEGFDFWSSLRFGPLALD